MHRLLTCCVSNKNIVPIVKPYLSDKSLDTVNTTRGFPGHLYMIKEREFVKTNENVYKIGKSTSIKSRMPSYPKNSIIYGIVYSSDVHKAEKDLIRHFDGRFKRRPDIGREYYEAGEDDIVPVVIADFVNIALRHIR